MQEKQPYILGSDHVVGVDIDDTLISWKPIEPGEEPPHPSCVRQSIYFDGKTLEYWKYPDNILSVETHSHKGHAIIVWSGSGYQWAAAVVQALGLGSVVDIIMAKPRWLLDDMLPEKFMPIPYWGAGDPGKAKLK